MSVEDERFDPSRFAPPWIAAEHLERYRFASAYVRDAVVVDCACGSGEGTRLYAEAGAKRIYASDIDRDAVASTAARCASHVNVEAAVGDAQGLPLAEDSADVFISLETFEHLGNQIEFLHEVRRVLRPGGVFICSTPNRSVYSPGNQRGSKPWNRFHSCEYAMAEFVDLIGTFFVQPEFFGQNPAHGAVEWMATTVSRSFGLTPAVRFKQVLKLPRFLIPRGNRHAVVPAARGRSYEYVVAVCRVPRPDRGSQTGV